MVSFVHYHIFLILKVRPEEWNFNKKRVLFLFLSGFIRYYFITIIIFYGNINIIILKLTLP